MCLERLLAIARDHKTSTEEEPRIENGRVVIPIDVKLAGGGWGITYETAGNRAELLQALGY
jgi:hypothetical protein